jgi:hypothetical protein
VINSFQSSKEFKILAWYFRKLICSELLLNEPFCLFGLFVLFKNQIRAGNGPQKVIKRIKNLGNYSYFILFFSIRTFFVKKISVLQGSGAGSKKLKAGWLWYF